MFSAMFVYFEPYTGNWGFRIQNLKIYEVVGVEVERV
jgi:hypothetical protein